MMHFTLPGLLESGHILALNPHLGTLCHLAYHEDGPILVHEQQLTTTEMCIIIPLLESYPYYCPHDVLLASFETGRATKENIPYYRERLMEAEQIGSWDTTMRPVRNALSRARFKVRFLGIGISAINEVGYLLRGEVPQPILPPRIAG